MIRAFFPLLILPAFLWAELTLMTENFLPYNYEKEGKAKGLCSIVVQNIQKQIGDTTPISVRSWSEAYEKVLKEKNQALFCTTRTEQREDLFKWVGPIAFSNLVFQENTLHPTRIKTLEDAKKAGKVGVLKDDSSYQYLQSQGFTDFAVYKDEKTMYLALEKGEFTLTTGNELSLPLLLMETGLPKGALRNTSVVIYRKGMYVAFSKDVPDSLIAQWQNALDSIKESGAYEKLRVQALQEAYRDFVP